MTDRSSGPAPPAPLSTLDRRRFVGGSLAGLAAAGVAACAPAEKKGGENAGAPAVIGQPSVAWRLVSSFPRSVDTILGPAEDFAARLQAMTGGKFTLRVFPAGELVPGLEVMDAVQQGTAHVAQTAAYYFTGKSPALAFECCLPFGLTARQQSAWLLEGGGLEESRKHFADFGILTFPAGNTGTQMGGWFRREIGSLADLSGLKMRIPGLGGEVMSRLGVTVQVIAGGEIYSALERGAIDAAEWSGPYDDEKLGFHRIARYYYYPGWWEPGPSLSYLVNQSAWAALPASYREAFTAAAAESATGMLSRYDQRNPDALDRLLQGGVELRRFPDDVLAAARDTTHALLEEQVAAHPELGSLYRSWTAARQRSFRWFGAAELAYAKFAFPEP